MLCLVNQTFRHGFGEAKACFLQRHSKVSDPKLSQNVNETRGCICEPADSLARSVTSAKETQRTVSESVSCGICLDLPSDPLLVCARFSRSFQKDLFSSWRNLLGFQSAAIHVASNACDASSLLSRLAHDSPVQNVEYLTP